MNHRIHWQMFLKVKSKDKAIHLLERFSRVIGKEITVVECERYWKDQSLFRCMATSPVSVEELSSVVLETLCDCSQVAHNWIVSAPQIYAGEHWEFSGSAVKRTLVIPGLTDVDFQVSNLALPVQQVVFQHVEIDQ